VRLMPRRPPDLAARTGVARPGAVLELPVQVAVGEVRRYLGYPRSRRPAPMVAARLAALRPQALARLHPRGVFQLVGAAEARRAAMPDPTERVALGLCTIGPDLEEEQQRRSSLGEILDALILDAFGSAAAEALAESLAAEICCAAQAEGCSSEPRVSPGYGEWPVSGQAELMRQVGGERLGVSLTPGLMMTPRKSVSFAVRLRPGEALLRSTPAGCQGCSLERCWYRRALSRRDTGDDDPNGS